MAMERRGEWKEGRGGEEMGTGKGRVASWLLGMDAPVRVHVISPVDDGRICGTGKCVAWCETVTE